MKSRVFFIGFFCILAGCASHTQRTPASADSLPGFEQPLNLDYQLYKNERYFPDNDRAKELASFNRGVQEVYAAQEKLVSAKDAPNPPGPRRVFHVKQHGCAIGTLNLYSKRPADKERKTFQGMFDPKRKASYKVVMRFSNGVGVEQDDKEPDVRGAAIKIIGVQNPSTGQSQTVDFLSTNSPVPFGHNFNEFVEFMKISAEKSPVEAAGLFAPGHPKAGLALLKATGLPFFDNYSIKSVLTQQYWGGHPYLLGDTAMKYNIKPTEKYEESRLKLTVEDNASYLRTDLQDRLKNHSVKFKFQLQLEKPEGTPIEDTLVEWKEKASPSIEVGEIVLDKQDMAAQFENICQGLRFTPAHYIPEHRPLSNMGRGRLFAYQASETGRRMSDKVIFKNVSDEEPNDDDYQAWQRLNSFFTER